MVASPQLVRPKPGWVQFAYETQLFCGQMGLMGEQFISHFAIRNSQSTPHADCRLASKEIEG